jgi:hypothetical protein
MNEARGELEAFVAGIPPEDVVTLRKNGWSIKDHLFHLATWDLYLIAVLNREPRVPALGLEHDPRAPFDEVNAIFFARGKDLPLNQVLGMFRGNRARIIEQVRRMTPLDLDRPAAEFQPSEPPPPAGSLKHWIVAITADHDREHHEWMREILPATPLLARSHSFAK